MKAMAATTATHAESWHYFLKMMGGKYEAVSQVKHKKRNTHTHTHTGSVAHTLKHTHTHTHTGSVAGETPKARQRGGGVLER